jgi:hypothetical protein
MIPQALPGSVSASRRCRRARNQSAARKRESPLPGAEQIYVVPTQDAKPWWSDDQVLNLDNIIDSLKRTYNVDENRVVVGCFMAGPCVVLHRHARDDAVCEFRAAEWLHHGLSSDSPQTTARSFKQPSK